MLTRTAAAGAGAGPGLGAAADPGADAAGPGLGAGAGAEKVAAGPGLGTEAAAGPLADDPVSCTATIQSSSVNTKRHSDNQTFRHLCASQHIIPPRIALPPLLHKHACHIATSACACRSCAA